jgi:protein O-GlcNAc transferase
VATSLLHAMEVPELVTGNLADYEALALNLARDPMALAAIKVKLAQNRLTTRLFDFERYRRHLEDAYIKMWQRYERGEPPQGFSVSPL